MAKAPSDKLFGLIKSLSKSEKRHFRMSASTHSGKESKKMLQLFDAINDAASHDEKLLLKETKGLNALQLSNLKNYLHDRILQSLRQFASSNHPDIQIREQIDYAQILFERRMFKSGMASLKRAKKMAEAYEKLELLLEIYRLEKNVVLDTIDAENLTKVDAIIAQVQKVNGQINNINIFSNLSLKLDYHFTKIGTVRNERDFLQIQEFFRHNLPPLNEEELSLHEKIHLYNLYVSYYQYIGDYEKNYHYSKKLNDLFHEQPDLKNYRIDSYLKSLNGLLVVQYRLSRYKEVSDTLEELKAMMEKPVIIFNENLKVRVLKYMYSHEINLFFLRGDFSFGAEKMVKEYHIEEFLKILDPHSQLIFCYKIACLYFGSGNFSGAIKWLQKIINAPHSEIGEDLHCFARIINLISHYELENFEVINYYIISTYRFLLKKEDLHQFQKYIISFLRKLEGNVSSRELVRRFSELKTQLLPLKDSRFEGRAFYYFDIISWLESKIERKPVEEIVQRKFNAQEEVKKAS